MLLNLLEFAILLTISPLLLCWAIDIHSLIVHGRRVPFKPEPKTEPKPAIKQAKPVHIKYASKPVIHWVKEGYPESLNLHEPLPSSKLPAIGSRPLADHLKELGLEGKQLNELKANELRKLGTRLGIKNACRARKKDLLKQMRGKHGYA